MEGILMTREQQISYKLKAVANAVAQQTLEGLEDTRLIQDYLGHRNIQHTVMYTATNPARFEKLWR